MGEEESEEALWRDDKALKDLEYSQRRTEKQQRRRERKKDRRYRRWKMLYLPAMLGMVGGTVLTLTATLQGLGRGSFLWDARDVVIIVGPVIIASGFICLMLAAGCTFQHEQETRQASKPPEEFIGLLGFVPDKFISRRRSTAVRSISLDTYDMPVPADLDPNRNYILGKARHHPGPRRHLASQSDSTCSDVFLMSQNSYSSTASWVKSLTVTHQQQRGQLTRQQSDSNILTACQQDRSVSATARRCLDDSTGRADAFGSHSDLHVVCTSSLASSGYHSSASDTTSVFLDARATCSRSGSKHVQSTCCSDAMNTPTRQLPGASR
nr:hypothetical protein BaRGS_017116 [Batillaria attramentaria]